ncbi:MAG: GNAT family N-acetyltransferase [Microbacterium sp.]|uniref:GNAT family N-acetyltransferase n=1 Tax=Microbacterium sp. TaxID=51671 RepID=UPI0039E6EC62
MPEKTALVIEPITMPASLDEDERGVVRAIERIGNAAARHDSGTDDLDDTAEEILALWADQTDDVRVGFTAERGGEFVGVGAMLLRVQGEQAVEFDVWVEPSLWGQGIEDALLEEIEGEALRRGRHTLQTYTLHRPDSPGRRLEPPTGFGSIPAQDRQTRFFLDHGYRLGQVERNSAFDLQGEFDEVERMLADALAAAGPDYRLLEWTIPTPDHLLGEFARVRGRLATDMPAGDLVVEKDEWDAGRVRRREDRFAAMGMTVSVAAVEHVQSGQLVAYNDIGALAAEPEAPTHQFGTLVDPDHRGHRLGMVVKCANLLRWRSIAPRSPRVSTFNAEENAHMLAINVAISFTPVSYVGAWKKVLA